MKKLLFLIFTLLSAFVSFSQVVYVDGTSEVRKFIGKEPKFNFFRDWTYKAEYTSGIGEYVQFYPVTLTNISTNEKMNAIQIDIMIKADQAALSNFKSIGLRMGSKDEVKSSAYMTKEELVTFIDFLEKSIAPNLGLKLKDKSSIYIFKAKELVFTYIIDENEKRVEISIPEIDRETQLRTGKFLDFWTEKNIDDIKSLIAKLRKF
jgi:hypothetical protein